MEIFQITLFDTRTGGRERAKLAYPAKEPYNFTVGPAQDVTALLEKVSKVVGSNTIRILSLFAHGYVAKDQKGKTHGGFGIAFGTGIFAKNATAFRPLHGKFSSPRIGIELVGCAIAEQDGYRDPSDQATSGGRDLCWAIARAANTGVRASSSDQVFDVGSLEGTDGGEFTKPGKWEGKVWIFTPDGKVTEDTDNSNP